MKVSRLITPHFKLEKFICPCCDKIIISDRFYRHMGLLEDIRILLDFPIIITSGYRCPLYNKRIGGSEFSQHMIFATDFRPKWGNGFYQRLKILYEEIDKRFKGVGKYKSWIHGDLRAGKKVRW